METWQAVDEGRCPFTGAACDGGEIGGCGFREEPGSPCDLMMDVPFGVHPRDWYNARILEVDARCD